MHAFGFDIGGTTADVALVEDGRILDSRTIQTGRDRRPEDVVDALTRAAREMIRGSDDTRPDAAGAGIAGQVTADDRHLGFAPNLGWRDLPLASLFEERLDLPVSLLNDVQAAALAEATRGAGGGSPEVLVIYVGTGVGGGIYTTGDLRRGCAGCAGEVGHIPIVHGGRQCRCGARGCLEAYAGGWAIGERAREAVSREAERGARIIREAGDPESITARSVSAAAESGDALARQLIAETADYLASGLAGLINVMSPCTVVLGGGVMLNAPGMFEQTRNLALERALTVPAEQVQIRRAELGGDAGVIGAADWAMRRAGE